MDCLVTIKIGSEKFSYFQSASEDNPQITLEQIVQNLISGKAGGLRYFNKLNTLVSKNDLLDRIADVVDDKASAKSGGMYLRSVFEGSAVSINYDSAIKELESKIKKNDSPALKEQLQKLKALKAKENVHKSIITNMTLADLKKMYTSIQFPDVGLRDNENILFVEDTNFHNVSLGNSIKVGDQTIYLISNYYDALKLAGYLNTRAAIQNVDEDSFNDIVKDRFDLALNKIRDIAGNLTMSNLQALRYFYAHPHKFLYVTYSDGFKEVDLYSEMIGLIKTELLEKYSRRQHEDPIINAIMQRASWNTSWKNYSISKEALKDILGMYPDITQDMLAEDIKDEELISKLSSYFASKFFPIKKIRISKQKVIISLAYQNLGQASVSYDQLQAMQKEGPLDGGYYIYKISDDKFVVSTKSMLTLGSYGTTFSNRDAALSYIRSRAIATSIASSFDKNRIRPTLESGIFSLEAKKKYSPNEEITILQYDEDLSERTLMQGDKALIKNPENVKLLKYSVERLQQVANSMLGRSDIEFNHDPNKAALFLYEIEKLSDGNTVLDDSLKDNEQVPEIVNKINSISSRNYIVLQKTNSTKYNKVDQDVVYLQEIKAPAQGASYEDKIPTRQVLTRFAQVLNANYRASLKQGQTYKPLIQIITNADLKQYNLQQYSGIKGFVKNGVIYLNSSIASLSDLYHEYAHLFLGMIKTLQLEEYVKLLERLSNNYYVVNKMNELRKEDVYKNINYYDLVEEAVVHMLSDHVMYRANFEDTMKLLSPEEGELIVKLHDVLTTQNKDEALKFIDQLSGKFDAKGIDNLVESINKEEWDKAEENLQALVKVKSSEEDLDDLFKQAMKQLNGKISNNLGNFFNSLNSYIVSFLNEKSDLAFNIDTLRNRRNSHKLDLLMKDGIIEQKCN